MRTFLIALVLTFIYAFGIPTIYAQKSLNIVKRLKTNTLVIKSSFSENYEENGFGFITGELDNKLFLVTAAHIVYEFPNNGIPKAADVIKVKFDSGEESIGKPMNLDIDADIAYFEVEKPLGFIWKKNCLDKKIKENEQAFLLGLNGEKRDPDISRIARITNINHKKNIVEIEDLNNSPGCSGGPVFTKSGIFGIITDDTGDLSKITTVSDLSTIEQTALEISDNHFLLKPKSYYNKASIIVGLGIIGTSSLIYGILELNEGKDLYQFYEDNRIPEDFQYPYKGFSRDELYKEANSTYKHGQIFIIAGSALLATSLALLLKEKVNKKSNTISRLSCNPEYFLTENGFLKYPNGLMVRYSF